MKFIRFFSFLISVYFYEFYFKANDFFQDPSSHYKSNVSLTTNEISHKFSIELTEKKYSKIIYGELFDIDPRQVQHLLIYDPVNGRFQATLQRSSPHNTQLELQPSIQIRNPFPYDLFFELIGSHAKYFRVSPSYLKQMSSINFVPNKLTINLISSIENEKETDFISRMKFDIKLRSNNSYLNELLDVIGTLKINVDLLSENKYEPRIYAVEPDTKVIVLDEGTYYNKKIAKIKAMDRDRGDPGRLEYFLLGSNLLTMNRTTGIVYLDGTIDAETEQNIKFYCFARDLAPKPFGMNSELVEFTIVVKDVDEFPPILHPSLMFIDMKENDMSSVYPNSIQNYLLDCFDKDFNSSLEIDLESIRYVNKHDTFLFMDDPETSQKTNRHVIKDLFRLIYIESNSSSQKLSTDEEIGKSGKKLILISSKK